MRTFLWPTATALSLALQAQDIRLAMGDDGSLYTGSGSPAYPGQSSLGLVVSLNSTGALSWRFEVPDAGIFGPIVGRDNTTYFGAVLYKGNQIGRASCR